MRFVVQFPVIVRAPEGDRIPYEEEYTQYMKLEVEAESSVQAVQCLQSSLSRLFKISAESPKDQIIYGC